MRKLLSCLVVVFIGTAGVTQTITESSSVSIKTNFKESLEVTTHSGLLSVDVDDVSVSCNQPSNSIFRIMSSFDYSNTKVLCAEKVCAFIYFKNSLLFTLSKEVMFLV